MKKINKQPRACHSCGERYHRRNLVESWVKRNPGHNTGWLKEIIKVCMNCCSEAQSRKILSVVSIVPVSSYKIRRSA